LITNAYLYEDIKCSQFCHKACVQWTAVSKSQRTLTETTTTARSCDDKVKVENISPDTSPVHHSANKPTETPVLDKTFTKTKQEGTAGSDSSTIENLQGTQSTRRAGSNRGKDRIMQKPPKKESEAAATAKTSMKTVPLQKDKPKEPTGYAAQLIFSEACSRA